MQQIDISQLGNNIERRVSFTATVCWIGGLRKNVGPRLTRQKLVRLGPQPQSPVVQMVAWGHNAQRLHDLCDMGYIQMDHTYHVNDVYVKKSTYMDQGYELVYGDTSSLTMLAPVPEVPPAAAEAAAVDVGGAHGPGQAAMAAMAAPAAGAVVGASQAANDTDTDTEDWGDDWIATQY